MTKSALKTGMIVTLRNGKKFEVYIDAVTYTCSCGSDVITDGKKWSSLAEYNEDLTYPGHTDHDIVMVEYVGGRTDLYAGATDEKTLDIIWKREDTKKMTVAEIEAILGCKVEIISDK